MIRLMSQGLCTQRRNPHEVFVGIKTALANEEASREKRRKLYRL